MREVRNRFNVKASFNIPGLSVRVCLITLRSCPFRDDFFCLDLLKVVDFSIKFLLLGCQFFRNVALLQRDELDFSPFSAESMASFVSSFVTSKLRCVLHELASSVVQLYKVLVSILPFSCS